MVRRFGLGLALVLAASGPVGAGQDALSAWQAGEIDAARAIWAEQAAAGDAAARFNLGILADDPQDTRRSADAPARDLSQAVAHYRASAQAGYAPAAYNLGVILLAGGAGIASDRGQAIAWLREAARAGDVLAQARLGDVLTDPNAPEGAEGAAEGAAWHLRAAEADHAPSQVALSMLYARGVGVARDLSEAAAWAERAETTQMMTGDVAYCTPESAALVAACRRRTPLP